jgi:hypothetical protein|nr:MAG TPA: hypothetical protein [Caudoviricetes sp.]
MAYNIEGIPFYIISQNKRISREITSKDQVYEELINLGCIFTTPKRHKIDNCLTQNIILKVLGVHDTKEIQTCKYIYNAHEILPLRIVLKKDIGDIDPRVLLDSNKEV